MKTKADVCYLETLPSELVARLGSNPSDEVTDLLVWCAENLDTATENMTCQTETIEHLEATVSHLEGDIDKICDERDAHRKNAFVYRRQWIRAKEELETKKAQREAYRQTAMDHNRRAKDMNADMREELKHKGELMEQCIKLRDAAPEWTPVSEPPPESGTYLVTVEGDKAPALSYWSARNECWPVAKVIAWMPKPDVYQPPEPEVPEGITDERLVEIREMVRDEGLALGMLTNPRRTIRELVAEVDRLNACYKVGLDTSHIPRSTRRPTVYLEDDAAEDWGEFPRVLDYMKRDHGLPLMDIFDADGNGIVEVRHLDRKTGKAIVALRDHKGEVITLNLECWLKPPFRLVPKESA